MSTEVFTSEVDVSLKDIAASLTKLGTFEARIAGIAGEIVLGQEEFSARTEKMLGNIEKIRIIARTIARDSQNWTDEILARKIKPNGRTLVDPTPFKPVGWKKNPHLQ